MRLFEILDEFNRTNQLIKQLELEYSDKIKGEVYFKRKTSLIAKLGDLKQKYINYGKGSVICIIRGKMQRPHARNPKIFIKESFTLYLANVLESEIPHLLKVYVPGYINYRVSFINSGYLLTSS